MEDAYYLNLGALSTNYLLSDRDNFKEIYALLRDSAAKMIDNLVPYVFSMNLYYSAVQDRNLTMNSILVGLKDPSKIFTDNEMGFGSIKSLSKWVKAIEGGTYSEAYADLKNYFVLKEEEMQQIVGPSSFLKALYSATQVSYALQYDCKKSCDNTTMFAIQWASQNITNLEDTFISPKVKAVGSLIDLDDTLFGAAPEFSFAVKNMSLITEPLNLTQTLGLASIASFDDAASIFNPRNLYDFFSSYQSKRYDNIKTKFKLISDGQIDAVYKYLLQYVIPQLGNYVSKNGNKQHKAFSRLITYTFKKTEEQLQEFLPAELYARYIGTALVRDKKVCKDYISRAVSDTSKAEEICTQYDFSTYEGSSIWTYAYYKGKESLEYNVLYNSVNMTEEEIDKVFDTSDSKSYGKYASGVINDVSKGYGCSNTPCNAQELAHMQFIDSKVTMNIIKKYEGISDFLFQAETIAQWGYPRKVPLEYDYFSEKKCKDVNGLTEEAYKTITQGKDALSDYQNAINFVINLSNGKNIDHYTELYGTNAKSLYCTIRHMTQDALLGGLLVKKDPEQIIFGYDDPILSILKEGNFTKGSDPSVQTHVSINNVYYNSTLINDTSIEVYTGNRHPEKVKTARSINGGVFLNNIVPFYDGKNVTYGNINPFDTNIKVVGSDGLQFGKNLGKGGKIQVFDTKKIQDVTFKYGGKKSYDKIQSNVYKLDQGSMTAKDNEDKKMLYDGFFNVSSSFKMPLAVSAAYFTDAKAEDYGKITFDGKEPSSMSSSVENWIAVEPVSGFMIESKRNELMSIDVHEIYLAFPDLDGYQGFLPVMSVESTTKIDEDVFLSKYSFVNTYRSLSFYSRVIFFPLAAICLIMSIVLFILLRREEGKEIHTYKANYNRIDGDFENEEQRLIKNGDENDDIKGKYKSKDDLKLNDTTKVEANDDESSP